MSENEARGSNHEEQGDEVEAHKRAAHANDEGNTESDDDVEAHVKRAGHARKQ
jgi:hypothetical protein